MCDETENLFYLLRVEHIIILILPFYMVYSGRYLVLPASYKVAMFAFMLYGLYHSPLIHVVALKSTININYIFTPPPSKSIAKCASTCQDIHVLNLKHPSLLLSHSRFSN